MNNIGFDSFVGDFSNEESERLNYQDYEVSKPTLDISCGMRDGADDLDVSSGDQRIMFEYENNETEVETHSKKLSEVRTSIGCW